MASGKTGWPRFLARVARDALRDRAGRYQLTSPYVTRYLSQPAVALSCDAYGGVPYVMLSTENRPELMDLEAYSQAGRGARLWLRIEHLGRFVDAVLPRIREPFTLVTGDSDHIVPGDFPQAADAIVRSGLVRHWYSTNYDRSAHVEVITGMPLGLNYARKNELIGRWGRHGWLRVEMKAPREQEAEWDAAARQALPLEQRAVRAAADFHMNDSSRHRRFGESRADIQRQLAGSRSIEWIDRRRPLPELLRIYARHAFVVSPHGNALDCYRTWEALLMGCIPIVKRSPIDYLYDNLPVAIVEDWREITAANLERWIARFGSGFNRGPLQQVLSSAYWQSRIAAGV